MRWHGNTHCDRLAPASLGPIVAVSVKMCWCMCDPLRSSYFIFTADSLWRSLFIWPCLVLGLPLNNLSISQIVCPCILPGKIYSKYLLNSNFFPLWYHKYLYPVGQNGYQWKLNCIMLLNQMVFQCFLSMSYHKYTMSFHIGSETKPTHLTYLCRQFAERSFTEGTRSAAKAQYSNGHAKGSASPRPGVWI